MIFKDVNNMETNTIIAEILKDKPKGTKLYSPLFGDVYLLSVDVEAGIIRVKHHGKNENIAIFFRDGRYYNYPESEPLLFPSKEMQDWSKFAWKKGDVLVSREGFKILFDKWASEDYTKFLGKIKVLGNSYCYDTAYYTLASKEEALEFIKSVEEINNGKLNLETLEIEKSAFKDGDILCVIANSTDYHYILIYEGQDDEHIYRYVTMLENHSLIIKKGSYFTKPKDYSMRYATDEEKQQLFDALAKEGKAWDSKKKMIVDLKLKHKFKPFDKIIVLERFAAQEWVCDVFSHYSKDYVGKEIIIGLGGSTYYKALPFNEETAKLLGTTDDVEG